MRNRRKCENEMDASRRRNGCGKENTMPDDENEREAGKERKRERERYNQGMKG